MWFCFIAHAPQHAWPLQERNPDKVRFLAEQALQNMVAPQLMQAAVTADYLAECLGFLRSFDVHDPDPAAVVEHVKAFDSRMRSLFVDGLILAQAEPSCNGDGVCQKTASQMVFDEIDDPEPILSILLGYYFFVCSCPFFWC